MFLLASGVLALGFTVDNLLDEVAFGVKGRDWDLVCKSLRGVEGLERADDGRGVDVVLLRGRVLPKK